MAICVPELRKSRMIQVSTGVQTAKRQTALASCLVSVTTKHLLCQGFGFFGMETCWEWIELSKIMNMMDNYEHMQDGPPQINKLVYKPL